MYLPGARPPVSAPSCPSCHPPPAHPHIGPLGRGSAAAQRPSGAGRTPPARAAVARDAATGKGLHGGQKVKGAENRWRAPTRPGCKEPNGTCRCFNSCTCFNSSYKEAVQPARPPAAQAQSHLVLRVPIPAQHQLQRLRRFGGTVHRMMRAARRQQERSKRNPGCLLQGQARATLS